MCKLDKGKITVPLNCQVQASISHTDYFQGKVAKSCTQHCYVIIILFAKAGNRYCSANVASLPATYHHRPGPARAHLWVICW